MSSWVLIEVAIEPVGELTDFRRVVRPAMILSGADGQVAGYLSGLEASDHLPGLLDGNDGILIAVNQEGGGIISGGMVDGRDKATDVSDSCCVGDGVMVLPSSEMSRKSKAASNFCSLPRPSAFSPGWP